MIIEILLAIIQAATEFLPVSSSGHLALISNLFSQPNVFFFAILHLASLFAVLIFTRKEIRELLNFDSASLKLWGYLILGTIPAAFFGYYFSDFFERAFSSLLIVGVGFILTGIVLFSTRHIKTFSKLNWKNAFAIGIAQVFAILPGVSRSGMTISSGMFLGLEKEKAARFSFLLFIPLVLGAFVLEFGEAYFSIELVVAFFVTLILSLVFLKLLIRVIKKDKFWMFGIYCFIIGLITLGIYFLS